MSRRDDRRKFENDVFYEAWRSGLNPDRAVDCADDCYWEGRTPSECVDGFAARERSRRQREEQQFQEDQYPEDQYPEEPL